MLKSIKIPNTSDMKLCKNCFNCKTKKGLVYCNKGCFEEKTKSNKSLLYTPSDFDCEFYED